MLFFARNFIRKSIAINDEKKDEIIPIHNGRMFIGDEVPAKPNISTKPEIEIAGIPIRKEILAAVCLSIPEHNAEVNVTPDLDTPGNIAKDCAIPNKKISLN